MGRTNPCRRITVVARRKIRRLAAIATARAAAAEKRRDVAKFRPLAEAEAEAIVRAELLAQVAGWRET